MKQCSHLTKHTQRLIAHNVPDNAKPEDIEFVIITWCADCGEQLKTIPINNKQ